MGWRLGPNIQIITIVTWGTPRKIRITVINLLGQEIIELVNDWKDIGRHEIQWQGQDYHGRPVASGMYFSVLSDGHKTIVQKMLLLK
ncbi:MAG: T9SS type A sorting domain-containing protein [Candidatus Marinimicrobia bacterium]|nr:T9SS type A sorting domain-containing protein [Candidatus Neomarinimicrobiota bacterium]MBT4054791.1 T9SS type A sorting domain-containing protein [Candidatus Neomarinimicrobiota bacterium]